MEYLSPGVYIEELPPRLRAIEGVSTSTVGMAGATERGPVPGGLLPFDPEASPAGTTLTLSLPRDSAPRLITSYSEFVRLFGDPLPVPDPNGNAFLGRAVRAFFDNGGKRVYISRVIRWTSPTTSSFTPSAIQVDQGGVAHLTQPVASGATTIFLSSLRGINIGDNLSFQRRADGTDILGGAVAVTNYNTAANSITVGAGAITEDLNPADVFIQTTAVAQGAGPVFHGRSPGSWGDVLRVRIRPADRGPVPIVSTATGTQITVQSTGSIYRGAILEIDDGVSRAYREVADILPGQVIQINTAIAAPLTDPIVVPPAAGVNPPFVRVVEIDVVITDESGSEPVTEVFSGLTWNPRQLPETRRRYYAEVVNNRSRLVYVQPPAWDGHGGTLEAATLLTQPATGDGAAIVHGFETTGTTTAGADDYAGLTNGDYAGTTGPAARTGIDALSDVDDISIIACPGRTAAVVQNALITQCEHLRYRFAVLDAEPTADTVSAVLAHRNLYDSSYAAYYHPWMENIETNQQIFLPPSGYLCGIYARVDNERGVFKAPANEVVRSITGLRQYVVTGEQDILNPRGVNVTRQFSGRGIRVWGARTLSSDSSLKYISTRRFLIFLEKSIDRGTQWVVFEPNNPDTWSRVADAVSAFLHTQWRSGALLGRTPEQAFFVRCDESTMTADDVENGRLICHIGVAITKPAEFVIFRIEQITAFGESS